MNNGTHSPARRLRIALAVSLAAAGLSACHRPPAEAPLAGARIGGPFVLTDQNGHRFASDALKGRYRLIYFGYTYCPDVCPTALQHLAAGLKAFEQTDASRAAKVQPLFITVDPDRDTPAVLKPYVAAFHPRLIGLTGTPAQIAAVAKAYAVVYQKAENAGSSDYLVNHVSQAILFGPSGDPMVLVPQDLAPADIAKTLETWVN